MVLAVAAMTLAALVTAHPSPSGPISSWSGNDLGVTTAWALAVLSSAWLVVVTAVCDMGLRSRTSHLALVSARLAPAFVRRLVEVAIVGSFATASVIPAGATGDRAPHPPAREEPVVRSPAPSVDPNRAPTPTTPPVAPAPVAPAPVPPAPVASAPLPARTYEVRAGDNLWRISRAELVIRGNAQPDDSTIARYWQAVIAANRTTLRSGNPNLIFPGELVALPEHR